jgi:hypothetical protein
MGVFSSTPRFGLPVGVGGLRGEWAGVLSLMGIEGGNTGARVKCSRCAELTFPLLWSVSFYAAPSGRFIVMGRLDDRRADDFEEEVEEIEEVVPTRAVLTELARGFLLVHDTDPAQAVRFAATFLKEQTGRPRPARVEPVNQVTMARLSLGRFPQGAVERIDR